MCDVVWTNTSGKLHFGTLTDENGVVRKVAIVSKVNVKTEDIGSTPIKDIESINIAGDNETTHITVGPTSGGTNITAGYSGSNDRYSRANDIYEGMCVRAKACQNGVNYWGLNEADKESLGDVLEELRTNTEEFHVGGAQALLRLTLDPEMADYPLIFVWDAGTNAAVPINVSDISNGKGSPVVVFLDNRQNWMLEGIATGKNNVEWIRQNFSEVVLHELFHADQIMNGNFQNIKHDFNKKYGTNKQWEIEAVDWVNSVRKKWQRTEYSGRKVK